MATAVAIAFAGCGDGAPQAAAPSGSAPAGASGGPADGTDVSRLLAELETTDKGVAAAEALRNVGASDPRVIPALVAALASRDSRTADAASASLVSCGTAALDALVAALSASDDRTRRGAAATIAKFGDPGLVRLAEVACGPDPAAAAALAANDALGHAGDPGLRAIARNLADQRSGQAAARLLAGHGAVALLVEALTQPESRAAAVVALPSMGIAALAPLDAAASRGVPGAADTARATRQRVFADALAGLSDEKTKSAAEATLTALGASAFPTLVAEIEAPQSAVRSVAIDYLRRRGSESIDAAFSLLRSSVKAARKAGAELITTIPGGPDALVARLKSGSASGIEEGLIELASVGEPGIELSIRLIAEGPSAGRQIAVRALSEHPVGARRSVERLLVSTTDPAVREAAASVVAASATRVADGVRTALTASNPAVRDALVDAFIKRGPVDLPELIAEAVKPPTLDPALLRSMVARIGPTAAPVLAGVLRKSAGTGRDAEVRLAAELIGLLGDAGADELFKLCGPENAEPLRLIAVAGLGAAATESKSARAHLRSLLESRSGSAAFVRATVRAAGLAIASEPAIASALEPLLVAAELDIRIESAVAVLRSDPKHKDANGALHAAVRLPDAAQRKLCASILGESALDPKTALPIVLRFLQDQDRAVRLAAIRAVQHFAADIVGTGDALRQRYALPTSDSEERAMLRAAIDAVSDKPAVDLVEFGAPFRGARKLSGSAALTDKPADRAIAAALDWLARHQDPTGAWGLASSKRLCTGTGCSGWGDPSTSLGVTGLALLAFTGASHTHQSGAHQEVVAKGLRCVLAAQSKEGCFGPTPTVPMSRVSGPPSLRLPSAYAHAICTMAVCDAYILTGDLALREPAQRGIDFILRMRNQDRAWRYAIADGDNDTSLTGWMVLALRMGEAAELNVDPTAYAGAISWISSMTHEFGRVGYQARGTAWNERPVDEFSGGDTRALTSIGVCVRVLCGVESRDAMLRAGNDLVAAEPPQNGGDGSLNSVDYYYWYFGTLALQCTQRGFVPWYEALTKTLVARQFTDVRDCNYGSWPPDDPWSSVGGRVYSTAICCMALEVPKRMSPLAKRK